MRVLITGGAGFLGSHLSDKLVDEGHKVICMDNLLTGTKKNIGHLLDKNNFTFVKHDVTEYIDIKGNLDCILHFASPASPKDYSKHPIHTLKVGALGTYNILGLARNKNAKILLASSSEVYGNPELNPQPEDYWGRVNPIGPRSMYDEAKRYAESICMAYHNKHSIEIRIARIFNTYGSRMRVNDGRALPTFMKQALLGEPLTVYGDGSQTRSFCYVDDLVDGLYKLLNSNYNEAFNLGNTEEVSILEFAEEVIEITGSNSEITHKPLPENDPQVRKPDISKARRLLNWEPTVPRKEGLKKVLDYFKKEIG